MTPVAHIVAISGSLRRASRNTAVLEWARANAPTGVTVEIADISDFPLYNRDLEEQGLPAPVRRVQAQIAAADAVLYATPEYNYSVTGPLKNAIDWLSRPPKPMWGKTAAILGVAGRSGSLRSQLHLREMLLHDNVQLVTRPEVLIPISEAFDGSEFVGERAQEQVQRLLDTVRARALDRAVGRRRVLVVGDDRAFVDRSVRLLGEALFDAVGVIAEADAVGEIEAGDLAAVLIGEGVSDGTRAVLTEIAAEAAPRLPFVELDQPELAVRLAVAVVHDEPAQ